MNKDEFKPATLPSNLTLSDCPVCGSSAELWQFSEDFEKGPIYKMGACSNKENFGPQDQEGFGGCLLYMPPQQFYRNRIVDAVKYWNSYAEALINLRANKC